MRKESFNPQTEIYFHFLRGGSLSVLEALRLYHTTELRRIVSRLNKDFIHDGKLITGEKENGENFKRYKLQNTLQMKLTI